MRLEAGTRLGPFEVIAPAGAGGMGEVYRARDTRLERTVAIKVLPAHLSSPEAKERFEREAKAIATLNHPNICTLHDVGHQDGTDFLVLEFLDGNTLADRLARGALPLAEALQIATQIVDALDKAHRLGIVHRDLKPGNIMLTRSGAKLLDFGLAKQQTPAFSGLGSASLMATAGAPLTAEGSIVGTLQYMAPEQLEGREADVRTDIFAFGTVLYEMLTGRRAFEGKSQVSLIAAIVDHDPPAVSSVVPVSPPLLDHLVKTCLAKSPDERWQHSGDLLIQLKLVASGAGLGAADVADRAPAPVSTRTWLLASAALVIAAVAAGLAGWSLKPDPPQPQRIQFDLQTPTAPSPLHLAVSPDGSHVASIVRTASGANGLSLRPLAQPMARLVAEGETLVNPFWSPDGRWLGFFADGRLKKVDLSGAPPQTLTDADQGRGGSWNAAGIIIFAPTATSPLVRVSAAGGEPTPLTTLDEPAGEVGHRYPFFLPDGDHFLYTAVSDSAEDSWVYVGSLSSGTRSRLVASTQRAQFAPPDLLLFTRESTLMAQRLDMNALQLTGDAFPIAEDVGVNLSNSAAGFSVSANGVLALRAGGEFGRRTLMLLDRTGNRQRAIDEGSDLRTPAFSRDLQRVAVLRRESLSEADVWTHDLARGTSSRLTFDSGAVGSPVWSHDAARVVYSLGNDLFVKSAAGTGQGEALLESSHPKVATDWSSDGQLVMYTDVDPANRADLWILSVTDRKPRPLLQGPFRERQARFSPDGKWFAYVSDETGRDEVYVQSFPPSGGKWQISRDGGRFPRWRGDGMELLFLVGDGVAMAVPVKPQGGAFEAGAPQLIFTAVNLDTWDVSPDAQTFAVSTRAAGTDSEVPITVILNWQQDRLR